LRSLSLSSFFATERGRSRVVSLLVALALAIGAPRVYAQVRFAVVDMQRALLETNDGRRAKAQLKKLFEARQEQLNSRQEALKRMKEDIEKQKNVISREALEKRMGEYQQEFVKLQQNYLEYQQELAQKEAELTKSILVNLQGVVSHIGDAGEYDAILDQGAVVWSRTQYDITGQVIREYNTAHPSAAPAATPPATRPAAPGARPAAPGARPAAPAAPAARPAAPAGPHPRAP
jgi:outer membrane protein